MTQHWQLQTFSPQETRALGTCLGQQLRPGDVLLLEGGLGVGKTHFAQGVALGLSVTEPVTSPTFTLVAQYDGRLPFTHMDLYRLYEDPDADPDAPEAQLLPHALEQIAFDDYLDGGQVLLIEWPQGVREALDSYLSVHISFASDDEENGRQLEVSAVGQDACERLREWVRAWA